MGGVDLTNGKGQRYLDHMIWPLCLIIEEKETCHFFCKLKN
jgi:hypothetical protein